MTRIQRTPFFAALLPAILLFIPFFSFAQSNYKPGYVVNMKGDTLRGFIDYQAWDSNPSSVLFKPTLTNKEKQTYSLANASAFGIDNIADYKKYNVAISTDITNTLHLENVRDTSFRVDTVFLKVLQKGRNVALYQYTDDIKTRFYISETPGYTPTEMIFRVYYDMSKSEPTVYENGYQKQLFALANKYYVLNDDMIARLQKMNYEKGDLMVVVSAINHISKTEFAKKYNQHPKVSLYAGVLADASNTSSDPTNSYSKGGGGPHTSIMPGIAAGLDLLTDPTGGRVEFRFDVSLNPARMDSKYTLTVSPYVPAEVSYNQLGIFMGPQAIYNIYNATNFKFYLGVGFALEYFSYSNAVFQAQNSSAQSANFPVEQFYFNSFDDNFIFKAGFRIHKNFEVYLNYDASVATEKGGYFAFTNSNMVFGVNYFFGQ